MDEFNFYNDENIYEGGNTMINEKIIRRREQGLAWYHKNKEQEKERMKIWRKKNAEQMLEYRKRGRFKYAIRAETDRNFVKGEKGGYCNMKSPNLNFPHWVYKRPVKRKHFSILCNDCHKLIHGGLRTSQIGQK